jgi:hypothetical protein
MSTDEDLIEAIRTAGTTGAPALRHDIARAIARGSRLRRRRRTLHAGASCLALAGIAAFAFVTVQPGDGDGRAVVLQPSDGAPEPAPGAPGASLQQILWDALGADWEPALRSPEPDLAPRPGSVAAAGLPAEYRASAWLRVVDPDELRPGDFGVLTRCEAVDETEWTTATCHDRALPDGRTVLVQATDTPDPAVRRDLDIAKTRVVYEQPDGTLVLADLNLHADRAAGADAWRAAQTWRRSWDDELVAAATDPRAQQHRPPTGVQVPNLVGLGYSDARKILQDASFEVPEPSTQASDRVQPGHVLRQSPKGGSKLPRGAKVYLTIAQASGR